MRIAEVTMFILVILLTLSVGINVFHYTAKRPDPVPEIIQVTDTIVRIDTIFHTVTQQVTVELPAPVYIDTMANVRTYRDTIYLPYGTIRGEEVVFGELLRRDLQFDIKIPEVYRTLEVNNTISRSIRNRMLFATIGLRTDFNHRVSPVFGVAYIPNGHRYMIGVEVGVDGMVGVNLGLTIAR